MPGLHGEVLRDVSFNQLTSLTGNMQKTCRPKLAATIYMSLFRAHTNGGVQQRTLLRRVLETAFEKVLRRVLRRCLAVGFNGKKGSEKGSEKSS